METGIANDFDLQTFKYNGSKFGLQVIIKNEVLDIYIPLDNSLLDQVEYENTINNLIMTGTLYYTDVQGKLDKIIGESFSTCSIRFWKERGDTDDGNQSFKIGSIESEYFHTFLINNTYIINRNKNLIKYKLELISINWEKMNKLVTYSNYNKNPESITTIIKTLLQQSGFQVDNDSFERYKSSIKINYITKVNDTVYSAIKYLLRRLYYDKDDGLESSIKFLGFSILQDKIYLVDMSKSSSFLSNSIVPMSMLQNSIEDMTSEEPMNMASINKVSRVKFFNSFKKRNIYKYDPINNEIKNIKDTYLCEKQLINNYFNNQIEDFFVGVTSLGKPIETHKKITTDIRDAWIKDQDKWETYWNNNDNIYEDMANNLLYNETLVLSLDGNIQRTTGGMVGIKVDREQNQLETSDGTSTQEKKQKYRKFEGTWFIGRVNHVIQPNRKRYKTNVLLCRNWTTKLNKSY